MRRLAVLVLVLPLSACGDYTWREVETKCPVLMKEVIAQHIGTPDSFETTETNEAASSVGGTAKVGRRTFSWQCGKGIATVGKVEIEVREGTATVYGGGVDEGFTELP